MVADKWPSSAAPWPPQVSDGGEGSAGMVASMVCVGALLAVALVMLYLAFHFYRRRTGTAPTQHSRRTLLRDNAKLLSQVSVHPRRTPVWVQKPVMCNIQVCTSSGYDSSQHDSLLASNWSGSSDTQSGSASSSNSNSDDHHPFVQPRHHPVPAHPPPLRPQSCHV